MTPFPWELIFAVQDSRYAFPRECAFPCIYLRFFFFFCEARNFKGLFWTNLSRQKKKELKEWATLMVLRSDTEFLQTSSEKITHHLWDWMANLGMAQSAGWGNWCFLPGCTGPWDLTCMRQAALSVLPAPPSAVSIRKSSCFELTDNDSPDVVQLYLKSFGHVWLK